MATLSVTDINAASITACIEKHFSYDPPDAPSESSEAKRLKITNIIQNILDVLSQELPHATVGTVVCAEEKYSRYTGDEAFDKLIFPLVQHKCGITLAYNTLGEYNHRQFGKIVFRGIGYVVKARAEARL